MEIAYFQRIASGPGFLRDQLSANSQEYPAIRENTTTPRSIREFGARQSSLPNPTCCETQNRVRRYVNRQSRTIADLFLLDFCLDESAADFRAVPRRY